MMQTKTAWEGVWDDRVYLPSEAEIWARAAELRSLRSSDSQNPEPGRVRPLFRFETIRLLAEGRSYD